MSFKPGLYYVGDLCYVFNNEDWDKVCELTIDGNKMLSGEFNLPDGRRFAMYNTKYGDGVYNDQFGNQFYVDSGTIGCVLVKDTTKRDYESMRRLGTIVEIKDIFHTSEDNGCIFISNITIDTTEETNEENSDEEESYEY